MSSTLDSHDMDEAFARVSQGDQVTLLKWGRAVARLVPVDREFDKEDALTAMENILAMTHGADLGSLRLIDMIHEGHKY